MVHGPESHRGTVAIAAAHGIIEDRFARLGRAKRLRAGGFGSPPHFTE
jgi:hypothetical protein